MQSRLMTQSAVAKFLQSGSNQPILQIAQSLEKLDINAFFYSRFINNMRVNCLGSHVQWLQYLHDHILEYKKCFENQFHFRPGFSVDFLNTFSKTEMVLDMFQYDMKNAIYLSNTAEDFSASEVFIFTTADSCRSNQNLLDQFSSLYQFCLNFKNEAETFIKATKTPIEEIGIKETARIKPLTLRQEHVLYYLVKGMTVKQIASQLNLAPKTIEHYLDAIKVKLNCHSRNQLIEKALRLPAIRSKLWG